MTCAWPLLDLEKVCQRRRLATNVFIALHSRLLNTAESCAGPGGGGMDDIAPSFSELVVTF